MVGMDITKDEQAHDKKRDPETVPGDDVPNERTLDVAAESDKETQAPEARERVGDEISTRAVDSDSHHYIDGKPLVSSTVSHYMAADEQRAPATQRSDSGSAVSEPLSKAFRKQFDYVFNGTDATANGMVVDSSRSTSSLGMILGMLGSGVGNDDHATVHFYHLAGKKLWVFHPQKKGPDPGSICNMGVEDLRMFALKRNVSLCVLAPGDYLYAPSGLYHSTCHVEQHTATLIQWDPVKLEEYGKQTKEREHNEKILSYVEQPPTAHSECV